MTAVTAGSRVRLFPLAMREEHGSWIVGRVETGEFINVPPVAQRVITLLGQGRTVGEVAQDLRAESGEEVDVGGFVTALVDLEYVSELDGRPLAVRPLAAQTFAWLRPAHVRWLLHPATAWAAGILVAAATLAALARPALLPGYHDLLWSLRGAAVIAGNAAIAWILIYLHELAHLATARAAGVPGRMSLGTRLQFLVAQTDVSGVWAAPRRTRMIVYLSGTVLDLVIAAGCLLARLWTRPDSAPDQLLSAVALLAVVGIPMQLLIFMRTDAYFVVQDLFGCSNLYADGSAYARHLLRRLRSRGTDPPVDPSRDLPPRERAAVRAYTVVLVIGTAACLSVAALVTLPVATALLAQAFSRIALGVAGPPLLDALAVVTVTGGLALTWAVLWWRRHGGTVRHLLRMPWRARRGGEPHADDRNP